MALLWCDGFDHYGSAANMTEGAWAEVAPAGTGPITAAGRVRTGTHACAIENSSVGALRRVLGGAKTTVGLGGAFYVLSLPTANGTQRLFGFRDAANTDQVTIVLESTGIISARRGPYNSGTILGQTAAPVFTAETYQHVEAVVFFSQTVGTVEVRLNGVTVLSLSGQDTCASALVECSQVVIGGGGTNGAASVTVDDLFAYDDAGSFNNSFIGDRRVLTLFPDADTIQADWTVVGSATGYGALNEVPPNGDTSYITAPVPGSPAPASEFGIQNLPAGISAVNGVVVVGMGRKTEAGVADTRWSVISGASESAGADRQMTEVYTYRQDVFETDPATAAPFTASAVDALQIKVERVQ